MTLAYCYVTRLMSILYTPCCSSCARFLHYSKQVKILFRVEIMILIEFKNPFEILLLNRINLIKIYCD